MNKSKNEKVKVPISPMIDIIFLMIFFFVLNSMLDNGPNEKIDLVKVENCKPKDTPPKRIYFSVNSDGIVQMEGMPMTQGLMENSVRRILNTWGFATVFVIQGDKNAYHSDIDAVLNELKESGAKNIVLTGEHKSSN